MTDTPRCEELSKRHAALTEGALPLLEGATAKGFQGCMSVAKKMIEETWALAETLERELAEERARAQDAVVRGLKMAEALQFYAEHAGEYAHVAIDALKD